MLRRIMSGLDAVIQKGDRSLSMTATASYKEKKPLDDRVELAKEQCKVLYQRAAYLERKISKLEDEANLNNRVALVKLQENKSHEEALFEFGLPSVSKK